MKVLIVVDMLTGFCRPGHALYMGRSTQDLESYASDLAGEFRDAGHVVIFVCDAHHKDDPEFDQFPPHCVEGTEEAEIVDSLPPDPARDYIIKKRVFSPFFETNLGALLAKLTPEEVHVVGLCTDICVLFAVEGLRNRGYRVVVHQDGVMASREDRGPPAMKYIERILGAEII